MITPDRGVLEGITRRTVIELCSEVGAHCQPSTVTKDMASSADEIFISSSAGGIMPVTVLDGKPIANGRPGPITEKLRKLYWQKRESGWHGTAVDYS